MATRNTLEVEENPEQYDELLEDWFCTDFGSSSYSSVLPMYLTIKRQAYPHWEKGALKDEVVVKLKGRNEKGKGTAREESEAEFNGKIASPSNSRIRAIDFATLATPAAGEPNNVQAHPKTHALYTSSPILSSPFTTFAAPHLPPATHFPPLDPRASLSGSKQQQQKTPTFSFSGLQMLAAATSTFHSSTLCHLAGLHNQVQGAPQSPAMWRAPCDITSESKRDMSVFSDRDAIVDEVDSLEDSLKAAEGDLDESDIEGWPSMKNVQLAGMRHTEQAFDDSFIPSAFSGSDDSTYSTGSRLPQGSECTCGHRKHHVSPVQPTSFFDFDFDEGDSDNERAFSFYFRTQSDSGPGSSDEENVNGRAVVDDTPSDHITQIFLPDSHSAMENFAGSDESSTRANANSSLVSLFGTSDSRTSSEMYLSPNFPESLSPNFPESNDRNDYFPRGAAFASTAGNDQKENETSEQEHLDNHRVYYFPAQSNQAESSRSGLRNFFSTTRRRVSSIGGAALAAAAGRKEPRQTRRDVYPATQELEKSERPWARKDILPVASDAQDRRVLMRRGRGRSRTLRPLDHISHLEPTKDRECELEQQATPQNERRFSWKPLKFLRRFSLRHSESDNPAAPKSTAEVCPLSQKPCCAVASSTTEEPAHTPHTRVQSGAVLFRNFSFASPRTPGTTKAASQAD